MSAFVEVLLNTVTIVLVSAGVLFFLAGAVGMLRFPDSVTRLHALTKADNLGLGLIMLGLLPQVAWPFGALKLVAIWALVLLASATATQLVGRVAMDEAEAGATDEGLESPGR